MPRVGIGRHEVSVIAAAMVHSTAENFMLQNLSGKGGDGDEKRILLVPASHFYCPGPTFVSLDSRAIGHFSASSRRIEEL